MIEIKATNKGIEMNGSGRTLDLLEESLVIVRGLKKCLLECKGGQIVASMYETMLRDEDFWTMKDEPDDESYEKTDKIADHAVDALRCLFDTIARKDDA